MPEKNTDAAAKLKKLGERVRGGFAKRHPIADKSLDTIRQAVREEWERERVGKRGKPLSRQAKPPLKQPPEPDKE